MTVIAWDGRTLAADRQTTCGEIIGVRTKIRRLDSGAIVATTGDTDRSLRMVEWFANGALREDFPPCQGTPEWARLIVARDGKVWEYLQEPLGILCEDSYMAWGSGAQVALGAMAMGADAVRAVEVACKHCTSCGLGVDSFEVN